MGIEGHNVNKSKLKGFVSELAALVMDLEEQLNFDQKCDLILCKEKLAIPGDSSTCQTYRFFLVFILLVL